MVIKGGKGGKFPPGSLVGGGVRRFISMRCGGRVSAMINAPEVLRRVLWFHM